MCTEQSEYRETGAAQHAISSEFGAGSGRRRKHHVCKCPLVQKVQVSTGISVTWGVVYGGDRILDVAQYEVRTIARKLGLTTAAIDYRRGSYRSVATSTDRLQAGTLLKKAKARRKDPYIVNMAT